MHVIASLSINTYLVVNLTVSERTDLLELTASGATVASFPGRSHLQFLIAYCMQKTRERKREGTPKTEVNIFDRAAHNKAIVF